MKKANDGRCSICGYKFRNRLEKHDARPVKNGFCCPNCNYTVVVPARFKMGKGEKDAEVY